MLPHRLRTRQRKFLRLLCGELYIDHKRAPLQAVETACVVLMLEHVFTFRVTNLRNSLPADRVDFLLIRSFKRTAERIDFTLFYCIIMIFVLYCVLLGY